MELQERSQAQVSIFLQNSTIVSGNSMQLSLKAAFLKLNTCSRVSQLPDLGEADWCIYGCGLRVLGGNQHLAKLVERLGADQAVDSIPYKKPTATTCRRTP